MQTGSPRKLKILVTVDGSPFEETSLHSLFKNERVHGEWFDPSARILKAVEYIKTTNTLKGLKSAINGLYAESSMDLKKAAETEVCEEFRRAVAMLADAREQYIKEARSSRRTQVSFSWDRLFAKWEQFRTTLARPNLVVEHILGVPDQRLDSFAVWVSADGEELVATKGLSYVARVLGSELSKERYAAFWILIYLHELSWRGLTEVSPDYSQIKEFATNVFGEELDVHHFSKRLIPGPNWKPIFTNTDLVSWETLVCVIASTHDWVASNYRAEIIWSEGVCCGVDSGTPFLNRELANWEVQANEQLLGMLPDPDILLAHNPKWAPCDRGNIGG